MGVPLFFRWLRKKYPEIVDKLLISGNSTEVNYESSNFDNLYLDMNGILHPASHGDGVKVRSYSFLGPLSPAGKH
jgi:5'-3' exoribonuclease 2